MNKRPISEKGELRGIPNDENHERIHILTQQLSIKNFLKIQQLSQNFRRFNTVYLLPIPKKTKEKVKDNQEKHNKKQKIFENNNKNSYICIQTWHLKGSSRAKSLLWDMLHYIATYEWQGINLLWWQVDTNGTTMHSWLVLHMFWSTANVLYGSKVLVYMR